MLPILKQENSSCMSSPSPKLEGPVPRAVWGPRATNSLYKPYLSFTSPSSFNSSTSMAPNMEAIHGWLRLLFPKESAVHYMIGLVECAL